MPFNMFKKTTNNPKEEKKTIQQSTPRFRSKSKWETETSSVKSKWETETCSVTASDSVRKIPPFLKVSQCTSDNSDMEDSPLNPVPDCPPSPAKKRWLKVGKKVESDIMKKEVK